MIPASTFNSPCWTTDADRLGSERPSTGFASFARTAECPHQRALNKIIRWVQSQPGLRSKNKALVNCIGELVKTDVSGALALAEFLAEGSRRDTMIAWLWMKATRLPSRNGSTSLGLPPEIMSPRKASWLWQSLSRTQTLGRPAFFPAATEVFINGHERPGSNPAARVNQFSCRGNFKLIALGR